MSYLLERSLSRDREFTWEYLFAFYWNAFICNYMEVYVD